MKMELFVPLNGGDCKGTIKEIEFTLGLENNQYI